MRDGALRQRLHGNADALREYVRQHHDEQRSLRHVRHDVPYGRDVRWWELRVRGARDDLRPTNDPFLLPGRTTLQRRRDRVRDGS